MTSFARSTFAAVALCLAASVSGVQASAVDVYLSAPFSQTAGSNGTSTTGGFTNAITEDFTNTNGTSTGGSFLFPTSSTGTFKTYTSTQITTATYTTPAANAGFQVIANGQFGGGLQGNYLGVPNGSPTTLTLSTPVGYFGIEWNAVDAGNSLSLYDQNNALIGTFNAATFQQILPNTAGAQVTALNGQKYNTTDYFGQPTGTTTTTPRSNTGEQYAYLNFVAQTGTKISRIVFSESTTAIFESDNHAILTNAPAVDKNTSPLVMVTTVPEPSTVAMLVAAGGLMALTFGRRRRG